MRFLHLIPLAMRYVLKKISNFFSTIKQFFRLKILLCLVYNRARLMIPRKYSSAQYFRVYSNKVCYNARKVTIINPNYGA